MAQVTDKQPSVLRSLDWWTIIIYVALLCFGWISVCGASYTYGDNDIFSLGARSGMQIVWIGTSIALGFVLLMLDSKFYDTFAYVIYMVLLLLLFATIFNPHEIKGSRSWLVLGPLRLQPAEFAKFATALAVAKFMSAYGFDIHRWRDFATACGIVLLPMLFIVAQKETGSALVYLSCGNQIRRDSHRTLAHSYRTVRRVAAGTDIHSRHGAHILQRQTQVVAHHS